MQQKLMRLWRTLRFPVLIACAFAPLPLLLTAFYTPEDLPWVWVWPVLLAVLDALGIFVRKKWRIPYGVFQVASMAAVQLALGFALETVHTCFTPLTFSALLLASLAMAPEERNERIHLLWYIAGVFSHLVGQFFLSNNRSLGRTTLEPIAPWLMVTFFVFLVVALITLNQSALSDTTRGRQRPSKAMHRKYLLLTLGFMGISLLISLIPAVVSGVKMLLTWILSTVWEIVAAAAAWLNGLKGGGGDGGGGGGASQGQLLPMEHTTHPILEIIVKIVTVVLIVLAAALVLFFIGRKIAQMARMLKKAMTKYLHAVSEDYVDEITDTREEDDGTGSQKKRKWKKSASEVRKLTPEQRIRYRYQQLLYKHPEWAKGSTARENLNDKAAFLYEQVRYRENPADEQDARQFVEETKKV